MLRAFSPYVLVVAFLIFTRTVPVPEEKKRTVQSPGSTIRSSTRTPSDVVVPTRLPATRRMWVTSRVTVLLPFVPLIETTGIRRSVSRIHSGGVVRAALGPVVGADRVAGVLGRLPAAASLHPAQVNGHPALTIRLNGELDAILAIRIDDGLITGLYAVRNPEKLSYMRSETALRR